MTHDPSRYNPFVFKKGPDRPEVRSMKEEMKKETEKASKAMEETPHTADEAAKASKDRLQKLYEDTLDKMGVKTTEDMNKPENQKFMGRLTEIHGTAVKTIDENLTKYENHVEAAKIMLRLTTTANEGGKAVLDSNYEAFEKLKKRPKTWANLEVLLNVAEALQKDANLVDEYGPAKMGTRTKAEILTDMNDQITQFIAFAKEIGEHKITRLNRKDAELSELEKKLEAKDPTVSTGEIKELWQFARTIRNSARRLEGFPQFSELAAKAREKFQSYWARIQKAHEMHVARSPELKAADEALNKAYDELKEAKAAIGKAKNDTEKQAAQAALEKAQQTHDAAFNYFSRLAVAIDDADLAWGASPTEAMIAAAKRPEKRIEGENRLAVNSAIEAVEDAHTVKGIKRAMIRLGTLIAEHGLDDISIRRRLQELGFRLPPLGEDAKEYRLVYYDPDSGDKYERSVKPLTEPVELEEKLADVRKKGAPVLTELDKRSAGATLRMKVDDISVKITKHAHREYKIGGKIVKGEGNETGVYNRIMEVALRKKRIRAARAVPGVRYVKAEKPADKAAV